MFPSSVDGDDHDSYRFGGMIGASDAVLGVA